MAGIIGWAMTAVIGGLLAPILLNLIKDMVGLDLSLKIASIKWADCALGAVFGALYIFVFALLIVINEYIWRPTKTDNGVID